MGRRSRQRQPEGRYLPAPVANLADEWKTLTAGEAAFVAVAAIGIVVLAFAVPGGVLNGLVSALSLGLAAGLVIALNRARRRKRGR